eukprot:CAMPEP_0114230016 /NCGR_PEP_ID=MMETSP0058-20121206/3234_1 /TAXON_ID=36894 /ORGANISM="Pyramimonas parkeae, CCMP726" /LENGTH=118 /DNA_ID=CAMNT_0001341167 /DNA_START=125 /DNA_END=481 /DNA_ORIENTATION=+
MAGPGVEPGVLGGRILPYHSMSECWKQRIEQEQRGVEYFNWTQQGVQARKEVHRNKKSKQSIERKALTERMSETLKLLDEEKTLRRSLQKDLTREIMIRSGSGLPVSVKSQKNLHIHN